MKFLLYIGLISLFLLNCNEGMSPSEPDRGITGVSGTVYFTNWPPADSIFDLRLILFRDFPPTDIQSAILSGQAVVYPAITDTFQLPLFVDDFPYQIETPAATFEYFAVAHQFGTNFLADWRVIGHYDISPQDTLPTALTITQGTLLKNINIYANFDSILFSL
ncbi:MAG: hypothetical protein EH225_06420 [Calditrichaeota bacterium]|nr:hypothetical protein [Calditrichota bacterium]RQW03968.1 MAG: hypothetical protein EH225_06420 [Calditrichota bacterium]